MVEIPNPKHQIPNKFQIANCNVSNVCFRPGAAVRSPLASGVLDLVIGICLVFEI
jgi:hypothetical protein